MKFVDNMVDRIALRVAASIRKPHTRGYEAASIGRLTSDMSRGWSSIEMEAIRSLVIIRERARDLARNNDYAKKAVNLFRVNVVGPTGFKYQSNVRELVKDAKGEWLWVSDELANSKIEQALKDWAKAEKCSADGQYTFRALQDLTAIYWFRDGEALLRIVKNPQAQYLTQVQIVEPEALDETLNTRLANGNVVKMGVEVDQWRRPVNYYLRRRTPDSEVFGSLVYSRDYDVVPAAEMIHIYDREFVNQTRGISLLAQSMLRLHALTKYEEAALTNARVSANKIGWFYDESTEESSEFTGDGEDDDGNKILSAEPGEFHDIGHKRFQSFSPDYPTAQHEMFVKTTLHGITAGVGMAYSSVTNDLGDTSYSSARVGLLEEREMWKLRQQIFIEMVLGPCFDRWLPAAILTGMIKLPMSRLEKFNSQVWIGRRWSWVDPLKDLAAMALAREIKLETLTQQLAEKGDGLVETLQEFAEEEKEAQKFGLTTVVKSKATGSVGSAEPDATGDGGNPPADGKKTDMKAKRDSTPSLLRMVAEILDGEDDDSPNARRRALETVAGSNGNGKGKR